MGRTLNLNHIKVKVDFTLDGIPELRLVIM